MTGITNGQILWVTPSHLNGFLNQVHVYPISIYLILIGVLGVDLLDVQVLNIRTGIGEAPGNPIVVPDNHTRHTGE